MTAGALQVVDRWGTDVPGSPSGVRATRAMMGALLELRGAALKIAQFLSLEGDWLPEPVAIELARACHSVPPMSPVFARDAVRGAIGPIDRHFASFDARPFAAATLGQVHAATTLDGADVVVKVQYPGMADTVRSDLRLLRRAAAVLPHREHHLRLLAEIEARLLEECDYVHEADAMAWFGEHLRLDGVRVPRVHERASAGKVLTTERLHGLHLEDWLRQQPSQAARDLVAQRLYDVFMQSLHGLGRLHADPNPGNFLFGEDGSVGLIDFGCTRVIPPDFQHIVARIWQSSAQGDHALALSAQRDAGMFAKCSMAEAQAIDEAFLRPFREWVGQPARVERFDFGADPGFVGEGRRRFGRMFAKEALVGIRAEFVLVNRTLYGLYRVFERLGARVRCQTPRTSGACG